LRDQSFANRRLFKRFDNLALGWNILNDAFCLNTIQSSIGLGGLLGAASLGCHRFLYTLPSLLPYVSASG
jgi:hypothetical protein